MTMSLFVAPGLSQEITIEKKLLNDLVRTAEKLKADNSDLREIDNNQKLLIETQAVRIIELENMNEIFTDQIARIKVAYNDIVDANRKQRFWVWLKGVGAGILIGAATIIVILL